ncbi:unnamed protein product [Rotaria socialis]
MGTSLCSSNNRDAKQSSFSRSQFGKSSNRRCAPAGVEDDDYDALFGSDEEKSNDVKVKQDKYNVTSACPPASIWNINNTDPTKRVDWAKMRRTDTANDMSKWKEFPPVIKEFYQELPDIAQMSIEDVQALRAEKNNIVVSWFDSSTKKNYLCLVNYFHLMLKMKMYLHYVCSILLKLSLEITKHKTKLN